MPRWLLLCLLADLLWGIWGIVPMEKSAAMSDELMQVVSTLGLLPVAMLFLASTNCRIGRRFGRGILFGVATGLCGSSGNYCILRGLAAGGEASAIFPITGVFPLVTLLLAVLILQERPNAVQVVGVFLALVAIALFSGVAEFGAIEHSSLAAPWMLFSLSALLLFGWAGITQKLATNEISPELSTVCFAVGFLPVAAGILFLNPELNWSIPARDWCAGLGWGALAGVAMIVQFGAYALGKASIVTPLASLYPAVTVVLAVAFYGETFDVWKGTAIVAAVLAGIALSRESPSARPAAP